MIQNIGHLIPFEDADVIDCTSDTNKPDYLSVKMSAINDLDDNYLEHHGILGMKWGIRRYQNSDGSLTPEGKVRYRRQRAYSSDDKVFVSGKVSYDEPISQAIQKEIDSIIKANSQVLIGDAPGADTRVQEYLASKNYRNVVVFTTDPQVRNNVGNWKVRTISGNGETEERLIRRQKDIAMTEQSTRGLAIMPEDDRPDSAMSLNVARLKDSGLDVRIYDYKQKRWV